MIALTLLSGLCFLIGGGFIGWVLVGARGRMTGAGSGVPGSYVMIAGGCFLIVGFGLSLTHSILTLAMILPP